MEDRGGERKSLSGKRKGEGLGGGGVEGVKENSHLGRGPVLLKSQSRLEY